mmetsp:Transcript_14471/g.25932  ORF Transcript_14471/g.25932 Transcript_14471/m.25932 type:complete len:216 (+) Transcript_14471:584-1231(+)
MRPAPSLALAVPILYASISWIMTSSGARNIIELDDFGIVSSKLYNTEASPPWAVIISANLSIALPESSISLAISNPWAKELALPASPSITEASASAKYRTSARAALEPSSGATGPAWRPLSTCIASRTSSEFPTAEPSGAFILVKRQHVLMPASWPIATMADASAAASLKHFAKAPLPILTSRRSASGPSATFLLITELATRATSSMHPDTSRSS